MIILEVPQGYGQGLPGTPKDDALQRFAVADAAFLDKFPNCRKYHRPRYRVIEAQATDTAPWGYEWYRVDEDGMLEFHSADIDSSG